MVHNHNRINSGREEAVIQTLTSSEIEIIQQTWWRVGNSVEMTIDFYNRLFYLYPFLRPMFKENIQLQARKFSAQISLFIDNMNDWSTLLPQIEGLGKQHQNYDVKAQHYNYVQEALLYALKNHMVNEWSEDTEQAWVKFYRIISAQMVSCPYHKTNNFN